jgi:hypothetical protein
MADFTVRMLSLIYSFLKTKCLNRGAMNIAEMWKRFAKNLDFNQCCGSGSRIPNPYF